MHHVGVLVPIVSKKLLNKIILKDFISNVSSLT